MRLIRSIAIIFVAIGLLVGSGVAVGAQDEAGTAQLPVEFTGHVVCGDQVQPNTSEAGDGESVLVSNRGGAWHPQATMSDPRLEGDYYISFDDDGYVSPAGSSVGSGTWRIENEEGAWQGSYTFLGFADHSSVVTAPLVGEGAYEGLTAVWESAYDPVGCDWEVRGLIIEGDPPAAPEAFTTSPAGPTKPTITGGCLEPGEAGGHEGLLWTIQLGGTADLEPATLEVVLKSGKNTTSTLRDIPVTDGRTGVLFTPPAGKNTISKVTLVPEEGRKVDLTASARDVFGKTYPPSDGEQAGPDC